MANNKVKEFDVYQKLAKQTAIYPDQGKNIIYPTLGLCGECGEIAEKVKKVIRDKGGVFDDETKKELSRELGDVVWYVAMLSDELGYKLSDIAQCNVDKLFDRKKRGKLSGSGDKR